MSSWKLPIAVAALALAGCSSPPPPPADTSTPSDAATTEDTSTAPDTANACTSTTPPGPYGSDEGRQFRPWTLTSCDGSGEYQFYGGDYCQANVTVMVASAGWCVPCQHEAPLIESEINQAYAGRGVRVIGVMMQNPDYSAPTTQFCNTWRTRYGQTHPFVIDPTGVTQIYFPNMAYPANVIIDREGRIRFRQYGVSEGLQSLREQIDAILAEYGQ